FFWVASVLVWVWSTRISGKWEGLAASLLFTSLPPVLAHAGLATTDMALTACLLGAIYAFTLWLERPTVRQTLFLGLASGAAVLSKFTTFLFLPACAVVLLTAYWFAEKLSWRTILQHARSQIKLLTLAGVVAFLVIWAGYRFSLNPLPRKQTHLMVADSWHRRTATRPRQSDCGDSHSRGRAHPGTAVGLLSRPGRAPC